MRRQWSEFSGRQRSWIVLGGTVQVGLTLATLVDVSRRPAEQINGPRPAWMAAAFVNFIGPIAYFLVGRRRG